VQKPYIVSPIINPDLAVESNEKAIVITTKALGSADDMAEWILSDAPLTMRIHSSLRTTVLLL
jgi:hypothetical protein